MNQMKRIFALTLALVLSVSLFAGCSKGDSSSAASSSAASSSTQTDVVPMDLTGVTDPYLATSGLAGDTVVATVGGYELTADDFLYWLYYGINLYASQSGLTDIDWGLTVGEQTLEDYLMSSALETAAFYRLIPEIGAQEGLALSQEDMALIEADLAAGEAELGGTELVDHVLWFQMHSREQYIRSFEAGFLYGMLQDHYYGAGSEGYPTDAEVRAYAEDELGYYHVKHILLSIKDSTTGEVLDDAGKAEKLAQAEDILAQLEASDDVVTLFDELMAQYSEDPGLAAYPDGYDAYPGQMVPEFEAASLALKDGEISGIVESGHGYHIILRLPLDLESFRNSLIVDGMQERVDQWMADHPTQTVDAYGKIDIDTFWNNYLALQAAVQQEVAAWNEQQAAASSSQG